jgi:hypothetical protein
MLISPTAFAAFRRTVTLSDFGKIKQQFFRFRIENLRSDRNLNNYIRAVLAMSVRAFAVPAAVGFVFRVVTQM